MRAAALLIIALLAIAALAVSENAQPNNGLPLVKTGYPVQQGEIVPWALNTRCAVNSRNLPQRDPERNA